MHNENRLEVEIISNFNMDSLDPALFILVTQSHLNDRLALNYLEFFNQRINMKFYFNSLKPSEVAKLIEHQLKTE